MKKVIFIFLGLCFGLVSQAQIAEGRYYISNGDMCLEADVANFKNNGAQVNVLKPLRRLNELWEIRSAGGGKYFIYNVGANKALDAHAPDVNNNGCKVQIWQKHSENLNQQWILQPIPKRTGQYIIRCAASIGNKVVSIETPASDIYSPFVKLSDNRNATNQLWRFVSASDNAKVEDNYVDLRGNQTPVKNQGARGSCTYFGMVAALEAAYKKAGYGNLDLSEEFCAIMGKALGLHSNWSDIAHSNFRENQFGGTQGGGSVGWYNSGLKIPTERDVPYRNTEYAPRYWDTLDQKVTNDYNFSLFNSSVIKAPLYYGATNAVIFTDAQRGNAEFYEKAIDLGYEINITKGGHNLLIVGYDKRDAANKKFLIKNSYGPLGSNCATSCVENFSYSDIGAVQYAGYVKEIRTPGTFSELAFLGRWRLTINGHAGELDIYHIPRIDYSHALNTRPYIADKRIGIFKDHLGRIFRVNGSMNNNKLDFYINFRKPNLRWDELSGMHFVYTLDRASNTMHGTLHQAIAPGSSVSRSVPNPPITR